MFNTTQRKINPKQKFLRQRFSDRSETNTANTWRVHVSALLAFNVSATCVVMGRGNGSFRVPFFSNSSNTSEWRGVDALRP